MKLSENDAREIERFKEYLRAVAKWDNDHDELPDFAPITELERVKYEKQRAAAHVEIYNKIYGADDCTKTRPTPNEKNQ